MAITMTTSKGAAVSPLAAIRAFFEADGGRKVTVAEVKALSADERAELAAMVARVLGVTLHVR